MAILPASDRIMAEPVFFPFATSLNFGEVASISGGTLPDGVEPARKLDGVAALETAGPADLAYMDNPKYTEALAATKAGLCLVSPRFVDRVPAGTVALVSPAPYHAFAKVMERCFPSALRPESVFASQGVAPGAVVHATAVLEAGVTVDPGAVIGPGAEIGAGTVVASHAVIGPQVRIGRNCSIGAGSTIQASLIGNRVIVHPGARIGQDGFGFAMSPKGHMKVPQIGRVIIQDDVEIGANSTIDRGASRDTVIGEGTKIDNLVQIGHNCVIGRHCVICAQTGLAGSSTLEDFVVLGGQVGLAGHLTIGAGAQIAAQSGVAGDVPRGARYGGYPAQPALGWARETALLKTLVANRGKKSGTAQD
jgi:UDP-3-O-[3-hydroxymyristoyl] glucosamine N-acyltransferase